MKILLIVGAVAAGVSLLAEALSLAFPPLTDDQALSDNPIGAGIVLITKAVIPTRRGTALQNKACC